MLKSMFACSSETYEIPCGVTQGSIFRATCFECLRLPLVMSSGDAASASTDMLTTHSSTSQCLLMTWGLLKPLLTAFFGFFLSVVMEGREFPTAQLGQN